MRESWGSQLGFAFAAMGSAIGLANIIRFPYLVGKYGGASFVLLYLLCLVLCAVPTFLSEIAIGKEAQLGPYGAFQRLSTNRAFKKVGIWQIITALIVSAFYAVLAGWVLGYFWEALSGSLVSLNTITSAKIYHNSLLASVSWSICYHLLFLFVCALILYSGLRNGLERFSKVLMPALFTILLGILIYSLTLPNAKEAIYFLITPDWELLTAEAFLIALGQSFFTLSAGQGTMITYGSYLSRKSSLLTGIKSIILSDTLVALAAAVIVYCIVMSAGVNPSGDLGMLFQTLPVIFAKMGTTGYVLSVSFFLLILLAALTSELSAIEVVVAFIQERYSASRHIAVIISVSLIYILGLPCALSTNYLASQNYFGMSWMDLFDFLATAILVPVGGLFSVILVGWLWKPKSLLSSDYNDGITIIDVALRILIKYAAPIMIILVIVNNVN